MQDRIPRPKVAAKRSAVVHSCLIVRDDRGRVLVEQRPSKGMWSRMWQTPTVETVPPAVPPTGASLVSKAVGGRGLKAKKIGEFLHQTTHREVKFVVWECAKVSPGHQAGAGRRWVSMEELERLGLSNPQVAILRNPQLFSAA
jgi:A/G-specific adenine glycosylase